MTIHVRAPATSANLGAGFDVAAVAFDFWNEMIVEEANGGAPDESHLGIRAFSRYASPKEWSFTFVDRIPRERGLGSSAAVVALGLVAGALAAGKEPSAGRAARGRTRVRRTRRQPGGRHRRRRLPDLGRKDPAHRRRRSRARDRARPAGAREDGGGSRVVAAGDAARRRRLQRCSRDAARRRARLRRRRLFSASAGDRLHEPYRAAHAPPLEAVRATCRPARSARRSPAPARR